MKRFAVFMELKEDGTVERRLGSEFVAHVDGRLSDFNAIHNNLDWASSRAAFHNIHRFVIVLVDVNGFTWTYRRHININGEALLWSIEKELK